MSIAEIYRLYSIAATLGSMILGLFLFKNNNNLHILSPITRSKRNQPSPIVTRRNQLTIMHIMLHITRVYCVFLLVPIVYSDRRVILSCLNVGKVLGYGFKSS